MEFHQLRYVHAVARHGSFSKAAAACHVTQPSLSQQILKLETQLGHRLFKRSRAGATLTRQGESLMPFIQEILTSAATIEERSGSGTSSISRQIAIGAIPTIAPYLLPDVVRRLRRIEPRVNLHVAEETTDSLIRSIREGRLDFGLASPPIPGEQDLEVEMLMHDELLVTLPERHPLARARVLRPRDLEDLPLVLMRETHCLSRQSLEVCGRTTGDLDVSVESAQLDTVLALVEAGLGISFTPRLAQFALRHRRVFFRSLSPEPARRAIALICARRRVRSALDNQFRECCRKACARANHGRRR